MRRLLIFVGNLPVRVKIQKQDSGLKSCIFCMADELLITGIYPFPKGTDLCPQENRRPAFNCGLSAAGRVAVGSRRTRTRRCRRACPATRGAPRWSHEQHRDCLLVVTIPFTKVGEDVFLLKVRTKNDPEGPKHVKEEAV